jgi:phage shock protein C
MTSPTPGPKRLTRSRNDKWLAGVCGGLAEYCGVDVKIIRVVTVALVLFGLGTTLLVYLAAWLLMPQEDVTYPTYPTDGPSGPPPPSE